VRRHRELFLGGQAVSVLGDGVAAFALPLLVLRLTRDPLIAALAAAPRGVGYLLVGLPAGTIVDRLNPWTMLITADVVRALAFVALPVIAWSGPARPWTVLTVAFLAGAATVVFDAALVVAVTDLFPGGGVLRANAALETATQISQLAGPTIVGVLAVTVGIPVALLADAATFVVSLLTLRTLARPARPPRRDARGFTAGLRYLLGARPILALIVIQTLVNVFLAVDTLIVFFARVTLALPVPLVSLVVGAGGVGGVAGAMTATRLAARIPAMRLITSGVLVVAASLVVMGVSTSWWSLLAANAVQVWAVTVVSVVNRSTRQALIPRHLLGRVTTVARAAFLTATPVGAVLAGAATRAFGPRPAFLAAGVLVAVTMGAGWSLALRRWPGYGLTSG
jgi:MFS family permease